LLVTSSAFARSILRSRSGYYYDWINQRWEPKPVKECRTQRFTAHKALLCALADEIQHGDSPAKLYASLLARVIVAGDARLMGKFGKQVASAACRHANRIHDCGGVQVRDHGPSAFFGVSRRT
jgi:hypothetical protein